MAEWYVAKTGDDENDGSTWLLAKLTIGAMVTASSIGDTIYIGTGDYDETVNCKSSSTLDGIDKTARIMRTGETEVGVNLEDNVTLKNLTISSTSKTEDTFGVYGTNKSGFVLDNCDITGADNAVSLTLCSSYTINNCSVTGGYVALGFTAPNATINNSTFYSDGSYSLGVGAMTLRVSPSSGSAVFNNCTIQVEVDNTSAVGIYAMYMAVSDVGVTFNNCIFTASAGSDNTGDVFAIHTRNVGSTIILNNCILTSSTLGSGTAYDLYNYQSNGTNYIVDSSYDRNKVSGDIFEASRTRRRYDLPYSIRR